MSKTKKKGSGGAVLLETKGREYFVELRQKGVKRVKKALALLEETERNGKRKK